jgi:hypothetical protein
MTTSPHRYRGIRFPAEIIEHAVWLYYYVTASLTLKAIARAVALAWGILKCQQPYWFKDSNSRLLWPRDALLASQVYLI